MDISSLPVANSIDPVNDTFPIVTYSLNATQQINRNTFLNVASQPVGLTDTQTLTNKTLTAPTISSPVLSGTVTGTYTLGGTPTFPSSVVTLTGTQTLTNKTLTSPTISSPTITNATLSTDAITGYTSSTSGTIYGVPVVSGLISGSYLTSASVTGTQLSTGAVGPTNLSTGAITLGYANITSTFSTANGSDTYITGLSYGVTIPAGGRKVKITLMPVDIYITSGSARVYISIYTGKTAGVLTTMVGTTSALILSGAVQSIICIAIDTPSAGSLYYSAAIRTSSSTANFEAFSTSEPAFILVEAI